MCQCVADTEAGEVERMFKFVTIWNLIISCAVGFHIQIASTCRRTPRLFMDVSERIELRQLLKSGEYSEAYQLLRKNPLINISKDDAQILLDNIESLAPNERNDEKQVYTPC